MAALGRPVVLVRHAHALSRSRWEDDDARRPLSPKGEEQSARLVGALIELKPARVISSPYLRCVQTVEPLAAAAGLSLEQDGLLAEGRGRGATELVRALAAVGETSVLCSHGDVIPEILITLANEDGVDLGPSPKVEKASVWLLYPGEGRFSSAVHLAPPPA